MLVASLALLGAAQPAGPWRSYDEVFDLVVRDGKLLAATDGGLIEWDGVKAVPIPSPVGLRTIDKTDPLTIGGANGREFLLEGTQWTPTQPVPTVGVHDVSRPIGPPGHFYAASIFNKEMYAGTSDGFYEFVRGNWSKLSLPSSLPIPRPNGIAQVGGKYVVGGLGGLYMGEPGNWAQVCSDSIRQIGQVGNEVWVLHGNGAIDKIDPVLDRIYPDLLYGATKRAWTSSLSIADNRVFLGGYGGWSERGANAKETYSEEIGTDIVTCAVEDRSSYWIGTEKSGVLQFGSGTLHRWNPGTGLPDASVTAECMTDEGLVIGTGHKGLFRMRGSRVEPIPSPTQRVTQIVLWDKKLVVGGMDGAWVQESSAWKPLATGGEETTSVNVLNGKLTITTAFGVYFF